MGTARPLPINILIDDKAEFVHVSLQQQHSSKPKWIANCSEVFVLLQTNNCSPCMMPIQFLFPFLASENYMLCILYNHHITIVQVRSKVNLVFTLQ